MSGSAAATDLDLLHTNDVRPPARFLLTRFRWAGRGAVRGYLRVRSHGQGRVPTHGPLILAPNHTGFADGPLLALYAPRPVHALTKREMFEGRLGGFLRATGQIELDRFHPDPGAIRACVRVLRDGGVVGVFPEGTRGGGDFSGRFHHGAAYLALVTGAPVTPVMMFGTRLPGASSRSLPPRSGIVDLVYGEQWRVPAEHWPRTRARVEAASVSLRNHLLEALGEAERLTGRLPAGPLPAGDRENDE